MQPSQPGPKGPDHAQAGTRDASPDRLAQSEQDHDSALALLCADLADLAHAAPESFGIDWDGIVDCLVTLDGRGKLTESMLAPLERRAAKQRGEG